MRPSPGSALRLFSTWRSNQLDEIIKRIEEQPITVGRRTTFYGMDEIGIREPGGTLVIFASQAKG